MASSDTHARERTRSYQRLETARETASKGETKYCSTTTRKEIQVKFRERFGSDAREWQLDVSEAILLGLDSIVIAGTGAGKTMPFMMPLLLDPRKKVVILSPLKVLQQDQVKRFRKMQIPSVAVNGDTWNRALKSDLEMGKYQAIFASPEMCLKNADFRRVLSGSEFKDITAIIIDEAHCISQWGGDFRPSYSELGKLRAFFPPHIPILATSATLTPTALTDVRSSLGIDADQSFFLNLGNDRPNHCRRLKIASTNVGEYPPLVQRLR